LASRVQRVSLLPRSAPCHGPTREPFGKVGTLIGAPQEPLGKVSALKFTFFANPLKVTPLLSDEGSNGNQQQVP